MQFSNKMNALPARRCAAQSQRMDGAKPTVSRNRGAGTCSPYVRPMIGEIR